jgi:glutamate racemase
LGAGPIGVFDSGVGGLSVLREIRARLPHADLVYVADSGHCPYGDKSYAEIRGRAHAIATFLLGRGARAVVVACNTATVAAIDGLRQTHSGVPFVGMEPAVKPAAAATRTGVVGLLATGATLGGERFAGLAERFAEGIELITQACPGLVERIEAGDLDGPATRALVRRYAAPLCMRGADTLVLGCTHYPFVSPLLRELLGPEVALIDTGAAVARQVERVLGEAADVGLGRATFYSTAANLRLAARVMGQLWGVPVTVNALDA